MRTRAVSSATISDETHPTHKRGKVPLSILVTGTPDDVKRYVKKLIDTVGKDGGYIMDSSTGLDDARPENVKAMFDVTRE